MATQIRTNGERSEVVGANAGKLTLSQLQTAVGGFAEVVRLDAQRLLVVNEEGLLLALDLNKDATRLARRTIVGDVLLCDASEVE